MTTVAGLRGAAYAIAVLALIDPAIPRTRTIPLPIELRSPDGTLIPLHTTARVPAALVAVRRQLAALLADDAVINSEAAPHAVIVAGDWIDPAIVPAGLPVSMVTEPKAAGPSLRLRLASEPGPVLPGWAAVVSAFVDGHDVAPGSSSAIVLEANGLELDRVEHRWAAKDERFLAHLTFTPPSSGAFALTVKALPVAGETDTTDNAAEVRVVAESRRLRVIAFDPRPSWASGFVRRVIEEHADFDVVARVGASRGLDVRTGAAPERLSSSVLEPFDLALIGSPEELAASDVSALESFARTRGGTIVLVADRRPAGPYLSLLGSTAFEEVLVDKPIQVGAADGTRLRGSEFAVPRVLGPGVEVVATFEHARQAKAPIVSMPVGAGRVVFCGVLDAWRYRGEDGEAFASFWTGLLARGAVRAPRRLELSLSPGAAAAGESVTLRATIRGTEFSATAPTTAVPAVAASIAGADGRQRPVRLWPTTDVGVYEGRIEAASAGTYDVSVRTVSGVTADTPLVVTGARSGGADQDSAALIAQATGGVVVSAAALGPLREHIRSRPRAARRESIRPMRSIWWAVGFVALLTAEWAARRRRGLR